MIQSVEYSLSRETEKGQEVGFHTTKLWLVTKVPYNISAPLGFARFISQKLETNKCFIPNKVYCTVYLQQKKSVDPYPTDIAKMIMWLTTKETFTMCPSDDAS